jgi:hypothetical protein
MSDYVHNDRARLPAPNRTIESRAMFFACYPLFLFRAVLYRVMPWRRPHAFGAVVRRESIFSEASTAASVLVTSSFMGL